MLEWQITEFGENCPITEESVKNELDRIYKLQKEAFERLPFPTLGERKAHLSILAEEIKTNTDRFVETLNADFGNRSTYETRLIISIGTLEIIRNTLKNLQNWMKPRRKPISILFRFARAKMVPQPIGVVGIISPWNLPLFLTIGPLIQALAAGNRVMIKVSEHTPRTGELIKEVLRNGFSEDHVAVITGDADTAAKFSSLPFDHLLYTGSTEVGKKVMRAASENLTPVTLELGGKNPAIISPGFPIKTSAERILFWKCLNGGQVCQSTDYVMVHKNDLESFVESSKSIVAKHYPTIANNQDYTSIINQNNYDRLQRYISDAREKGAEVIEINPANENFEPDKRKIPLTILLKVTDDMLAMQEEIFGPLLPVLTYQNLDDAISYVNSKPRPLSLFYFDNDSSRIDKVLKRTISGGVVVNDAFWHFAQDGMPVGGVGASGMGRYHGKEGFDTFSHIKPIIYQSNLSLLGLLRPPFGKIIELVNSFTRR